MSCRTVPPLPRCRPRVTLLEDRTAPAVATWDGGGADNKWTTAANWAGDVAPHAGDDLVFPVGAQQLTNVNDFAANTVFGSLALAGGYQISGTPLAVAGGVRADIPAGGSSTLALAFGGLGGLTKAGAGTLALSGANTYAGVTAVNAGTLEVRSDTALGVAGSGNETTVADGATLALSGTPEPFGQPPPGPRLTVAEPIAFAGRGMGGTAGAIANAVGINTLSGPLTLTGNALIAGAFGNHGLTITSGVGEAGGPRDLEVSVGGNGLTFAASAVNTFTGRMTVAANGVRFDGRGVGPATVAGPLGGTGTLGPLQTVPGGSVYPAAADGTPGTLTTGDLDLTGGGTIITIGPHSYSRFVVRGTVRLGGDPAVSTTVFGQEAHVRVGDTFTIVENDGTDPVTGTFNNLPEGAVLPFASLPVRLRISYRGGDGNDVVLVGVSETASAAAAGPGGEPLVNVYDGGGNLIRTFLAYPDEFRGGVHVATRDVTGDGVPDIVTAPGVGGGPVVRVWDGTSGAMVREFNAYDPSFRGGAFVACADIDADGHMDIVTGAGPGGGPHVEVFSGATGAVLSSFYAYDPGFRGGVSVAATNGANSPIAHIHFNGSVITGAGPGGGPHVRVFDGLMAAPTAGFYAYDPAFTGGVNVAVGSLSAPGVNGLGIVTAPASAGGPDVRVYDFAGQLRSSFLAYGAAFRGGVSVAVLLVGVNGTGAILTGAGGVPAERVAGGPHVEQWEYPGPATTRSLLAFDPAFTGGVFVG